jgi:hypothetical protein
MSKRGYTGVHTTRNREQVKERNRERYKKGGKERNRSYSKTPRSKYLRYKHSAKYTGRVFEFTEAEFIETFWNKPCYYCGDFIDTVGVDRVDSTKGYSKDNCVSCCEDCNRMKMDRPVDAWLNKLSKILKHLK